MFDIAASGWMGELDAEARQKLAALLELRNEYQLAVIELNRRRIMALHDPTPENEAGLAEFASVSVASVRGRLGEEMVTSLGDAIDFDGLKEVLPMLVAVVTSSINIPMALTVIGIEPDTINQIVDALSEFIKTGIPGSD